jgi:hypothetical protein
MLLLQSDKGLGGGGGKGGAYHNQEHTQGKPFMKIHPTTKTFHKVHGNMDFEVALLNILTFKPRL